MTKNCNKEKCFSLPITDSNGMKRTTLVNY